MRRGTELGREWRGLSSVWWVAHGTGMRLRRPAAVLHVAPQATPSSPTSSPPTCLLPSGRGPRLDGRACSSPLPVASTSSVGVRPHSLAPRRRKTLGLDCPHFCVRRRVCSRWTAKCPRFTQQHAGARPRECTRSGMQSQALAQARAQAHSCTGTGIGTSTGT
eukprot:10548790-Alexandrium_andersonii.AAC.1